MMDKATTDKASGPLRGLKIVDISTVVAGPFAAGLLGDYHAEVILNGGGVRKAEGS